MGNFIHLEDDLLQISGATKVVSSTSAQAVVEMNDRAVVISGSGIEVKKLSLDDGEVCFSGKFNNLKLSEAKGEKGSLFKRIFK